jgi:hypothetical protein
MANRKKERCQRQARFESEFERELCAEAERDLALHPDRQRPLRFDETSHHYEKPEPYVDKGRKRAS